MDTSYPAKTQMGRDMSGLRSDKKLNNTSKPNGTNRPSVYVAPRIAVERDNPEVDGHSANGIAVYDSHEKTDVLGDKRTNLITGSPGVKTQKDESFKPSEKKISYPVKPASGSTAAGLQQTFNIVPEARSLANDNQNLGLSDANGAEMVESGTTGTDKINELHSTSLPPASMETMLSYDRKYLDEDDNLSLASSAATSVRTTRSKLTVPVAPTFKCVDRIERRKEYYLKLEEKHRALEAEKIDYAARTKEEEQAAIKQLRKSMMYKANPVPNFYKDGPPPKVELKKLPVTRAKSPNLSRRKSCSDASKSASKPSPDERGACGRVKRHSFGFSPLSNSPTSTSKTKAPLSGGKNLPVRASRESPNSAKRKNGTLSRQKQNVDGRNRFSNSPKQVKETSKTKEFSAVEEVKVVADRVAEITVIEETAAIQKQLEPEFTGGL